MIKFNNIPDQLNGLVTIQHIGGESPLKLGEPTAFYQPFRPLSGFIQGMGIPVSEKKMDAVMRRQNRSPEFEFRSTLVRSVDHAFFYASLRDDTVENVTGRRKVKIDGKYQQPKLSVEEQVACVLVDFAMCKFYDMSQVTISIKFFGGGELTWKK